MTNNNNYSYYSSHRKLRMVLYCTVGLAVRALTLILYHHQKIMLFYEATASVPLLYNTSSDLMDHYYFIGQYRTYT